MVFQKSTSQSGIDRMRFNLEATKTFKATMGLGAGIGSVRASSFLLAHSPISVCLGRAVMAYFIVTVFLTGSDSDESFSSGERSGSGSLSRRLR